MSEDLLDGIPQDELDRFLAFRERVAGTNISEATLLATDYLNHFNEIIMLLEMIPDMPEIIDEAKEWQPKSYAEHFRDSTFSDKALAIAAYDAVPSKFRRPFEETVAHMDRLVPQSLDHLEQTMLTGDMELLRVKAQAVSHALQRLMDVASGIIHGSSATMDQGQIDDLIGATGVEPAEILGDPPEAAPTGASIDGLAALPNIGEASAAKLAEAGVPDVETLHAIGAVEAYRRVLAHDPDGTPMSFLYALQAALMDRDWRDLPAEIKQTLDAELNA